MLNLNKLLQLYDEEDQDLIKMYVLEQKSAYTIIKENEKYKMCNPNNIYRRLRSLGIPIRSKSDDVKLGWKVRKKNARNL